MTVSQSPPRAATRRISTLDESGLIAERLVLVGSDNATVLLRDGNGKERWYSDWMSAYASVNFGHRNPYVERALARSSDLVALFQTEEAEQVAGWLCDRLGGDRRVLFQIGGSFAVSTAVALARRNRPGRVLGIDGAFHGLGVDTGALSTVQRDFSLQDTGFPALLAGQVGHLGPGQVPDDWSGVSCLLYEPVQGANGYVPLDPDWLRRLEASARAAGVICIADEIQCGYYRHGPFSPSAAAGLDPDIVLFAKSLTNGAYPLSAVVYRTALERGTDTVHLAHTFQTGTLGPAAALEVTRFIDDHDVPALAAGVGAPLAGLAGRLRDEGLAEGVHATGPALSFTPLARQARDVVRRALAEGLLVFTGGRHGERVRVAPPLTTPRDELLTGVQILAEAAR